MKLSTKVPETMPEFQPACPRTPGGSENAAARRLVTDRPWSGPIPAVTSVSPAQSFVPSRTHVRDGWGLAAVVDAKVLPWSQRITD